MCFYFTHSKQIRTKKSKNGENSFSSFYIRTNTRGRAHHTQELYSNTGDLILSVALIEFDVFFCCLYIFPCVIDWMRTYVCSVYVCLTLLCFFYRLNSMIYFCPVFNLLLLSIVVFSLLFSLEEPNSCCCAFFAIVPFNWIFRCVCAMFAVIYRTFSHVFA